MRILFFADLHIKLGQKNVPVTWQRNRFLQLAQEIKQAYFDNGCDLVIAGGDIFDTNKPTSAETDLNTEFFTILKVCNLILYTGNHEMLNKKDSALYNYASTMREISDKFLVVTEPYRSPDFDIIDYAELKKKDWVPAQSKLCFTHVRGEIPPHVQPEIDLTRFTDHGYNMVVAGDLHSYLNSQTIGGITPLLYPGSPLSTSFARSEPKNTHGYFIIDTAVDHVEWKSLDHLPQLITKTITVDEEMEAHDYHHVMYELEGNILELKSVANTELLKKKVNKAVSTESKLDLKDKSVAEELSILWKDVYKLPESDITRLSQKMGEFTIV